MPDETITFAARFEFLSAIDLNWPDVRESLLRDTFPVYQACLETIAPSTILQDLPGLLEALECGTSPEVNQIDLAVRAWAETHGFQDDWFRDVALQTMHGWAGGASKSKWIYFPRELGALKFEPDLGYWIPPHAKWPEFKRLTDNRYKRELAQYRAKISTLWGEGKPKLSQSAVWTVLWQRGKSPQAIQIHHRRTTGKSVSLANIQQRVHAFADSAGLRLRPSRGGTVKKI